MRHETRWRWGGTLLFTLLAGCPRAGVTPSVTTGLTRDSHLRLFLTAEDLGGMRMVQDTRVKGPDPGDVEFARHRGVSSGFAAWMGRSDAPLWRLVDIRWVFPTAELARRYLLRAMPRNSERQPPLSGVPLIGDDCHVFGGRQAPVMGMSITHFFYLFRVGNVVVKLYAAQGPSGVGLSPGQVAGIAQAIARRIVATGS